ncbi:hypothetical protein ACIQB5_48790 [Streptomyces sp. NPDC088560]|uniref:hypothetical protein n=1 Tax=Streptomyces sp. NPDC088560 TaxID=3365868 RepID=UPI00382E493F
MVGPVREARGRLPAAQEPVAAGTALAAAVGADGYRLLGAVRQPSAPARLRELPGLETVRQVWVQQYYHDQNGHRWRDKSDLPPSTTAIGSPYDIDARCGIKCGRAGAASRNM